MRAWLTALVLALALALPASAGAHAFLQTSTPASGASLAHAPGSVSLLFTEPVSAELAHVQLSDVRGKALGEARPENESWWPAYTAWQAFAVKVLAENGRNQDSNITRLYGYRDRMPVFALAYLNDALVTPPRPPRRRPARASPRASPTCSTSSPSPS